jgi:hypothetical protein
VECVVADFMTVDSRTSACSTSSLYFRVLYQMSEPDSALQRLRRVISLVAVIETAAAVVKGHDHASLLAFDTGKRAWEPTTKTGSYPPTPACKAWARAAGFRVEARVGPTASPEAHSGIRNRLTGVKPAHQPVQRYRTVVMPSLNIECDPCGRPRATDRFLAVGCSDHQSRSRSLTGMETDP